MSSVSTIVLCASALFVQTISAECLRAPAWDAWKPAPAPIAWTPSCGAAYYDNIIGSNLASASGGGLGVISSSLYAPNGLSVLSENDISGMLDASGNLPVLAAVALEGSLPTSGSAGTTYSCGNELVGIDSESLAVAGIDATGYRTNYGSAFAANAAAAAAANAAAAGAFGHHAYASPAVIRAPGKCY
ncbi:chorion class B protein PC10-like [Hyposmocoma kahamanoa]|uniref:chorion class B protein PC10-like n=1 Tax=Hyposmocoma kahamanoa TaxID=1477025 RepID=UPI000E6D9BE7|nr:chorion class B protein PC10-like [Hyposmocoma kahamanoa]